MNIFQENTNKTLSNIGFVFIIASFIYSILKTSFLHALVNALIWWIIFWVIIKISKNTHTNKKEKSNENADVTNKEGHNYSLGSKKKNLNEKIFIIGGILLGTIILISSYKSAVQNTTPEKISIYAKNSPIVCQLEDINAYTNQDIYEGYMSNPFRIKEKVDGNCIKLTSKVTKIGESGTFVAFGEKVDSISIESFCMEMNVQDTLKLNIGDLVSFYGQAGTLEKERENLISIPFYNECKLIH
jgi:hypothetical protein